MSSNLVDSVQLAEDGLDSAASERYEEAVNLFSQAIKLHDKDFRYFINRSYCYFHLGKFTNSLADAEAAVMLNPSHPKPHFRKAQALQALGRIKESVDAFERVIEVDPTCETSKEERKYGRKYILMEAGFKETEAEKYSDISTSIEDLIKNKRNEVMSMRQVNNMVAAKKKLATEKAESGTNINYGDPSTMTCEIKAQNGHKEPSELVPSSPGLSNSVRGNVSSPLGLQRPDKLPKDTESHRLRSSGDLKLTGILNEVATIRPLLLANDVLQRPTNLLKYNSLYVSNLSPDIQKRTILSIFSKYGEVVKVGIIRNEELPYKQVAIHYNNPESPAMAMGELRDKIFGPGDRVTYESLKPLVMMFTPDMKQREVKITRSEAIGIIDDQLECFDWRGPGGCESRSECSAKHHRINRSVDTHLFLLPDPEPDEDY